jgi:hypothetical protein
LGSNEVSFVDVLKRKEFSCLMNEGLSSNTGFSSVQIKFSSYDIWTAITTANVSIKLYSPPKISQTPTGGKEISNICDKLENSNVTEKAGMKS